MGGDPYVMNRNIYCLHLWAGMTFAVYHFTPIYIAVNRWMHVSFLYDVAKEIFSYFYWPLLVAVCLISFRPLLLNMIRIGWNWNERYAMKIIYSQVIWTGTLVLYPKLNPNVCFNLMLSFSIWTVQLLPSLGRLCLDEAIYCHKILKFAQTPTCGMTSQASKSAVWRLNP